MISPASWKRGEKTALARKLSISPSYLSDIIHGRRHATAELAVRIESASAGRLTRLDVLYPHESINPLIEVNRVQ